VEIQKNDKAKSIRKNERLHTNKSKYLVFTRQSAFSVARSQFLLTPPPPAKCFETSSEKKEEEEDKRSEDGVSRTR
jgi:hypothetical protein